MIIKKKSVSKSVNPHTKRNKKQNQKKRATAAQEEDNLSVLWTNDGLKRNSEQMNDREKKTKQSHTLSILRQSESKMWTSVFWLEARKI